MTPIPFLVFNFSIRFIGYKKSYCRYLWMAPMWIGPFSQNYATIWKKMTVSYFQLDHAVSMLFMELSRLKSRTQIGNSKTFWETCIKFCTTCQLGEIITLMWPEVVDFLFYFVVDWRWTGSSSSYWNLGWHMPTVYILAVTAWNQVTVQSKLFNSAICNQRPSWQNCICFLI